ncbi:low molecular weight protein-tyrosine-phosphatase [Thioflexithrix psekupsensis]|uniref:protein-tyrosine-phosphatase n=1 Tax=Thioflexithrix psekupsensis TaxID=1570016 RepID=A0A251X8H8_9GAMM|nr:low molecular weight protein-tyrosine-phosphatase [Thioflexithrix psekupsensis]OUD13842.1 phosphotyrosine protein phosphatase [Thioflexithrix psekupsensis]
MPTEPLKVLFVCMGNYCRSPSAEGLFLKMLQEQGLTTRVHVDSAGTHDYHVGDAPDPRSQRAAKQRGIDLSALRGRQIDERTDFAEFDYILPMDKHNHANLYAICPPEHRHKIRLFMTFAPERAVAEVPDPYMTGEFSYVLDLLEAACAGLLTDIKQRLE